MYKHNISSIPSFLTNFSTGNQSLNRTNSINSKNIFMLYSLIVYVTPLVILGVCGNIICAIIFCTKSLRHIHSSSYLLTLALIDVFFLIDLLPGMIHTAFIPNLYRKINLICNVQTYVSFVVSFVHIWMVLAFTAERFFAVNFPLKHLSYCTPNLSRAIIFIIIIPAMICYIHPAFFVSQVDKKGQCREKADYQRYLNNLNIIDTILTMFLPFVIVLILNVLIIRKLFCSKTFRQHVFDNGSRYQYRRSSTLKDKEKPRSSQMENIVQPNRTQNFIRLLRLSTTSTQPILLLYRTINNPEATTTTNLNSHNVLQERQVSFSSSSSSSNTKTRRSSRISKRNETAHRHVFIELRLTKMLLAISLICLALNFPSYYLRFMFLYTHSKSNTTSKKTNTNDIDFSFYRDVIFYYLSYLSYSINIFIYILFGGNFRRALKRLFSLPKSHSNSSNSTLRKLFNHDKKHGNFYEYDSSRLTLSSINNSLRTNSKSTKL